MKQYVLSQALLCISIEKKKTKEKKKEIICGALGFMLNAADIITKTILINALTHIQSHFRDFAATSKKETKKRNNNIASSSLALAVSFYYCQQLHLEEVKDRCV